MTPFRITSTSDVSLEKLRRATSTLSSRIALQIDPLQGSFKSFEAPSWVHFFQSPEFWVEAFVGGLSYDLVKEAGRKAWRHRGDLQIVAREGTDLALRELAECLVILRKNLGAETALRIGFPIPDDWFGSLMLLEGDQPAVLAMQVSLFLAHVPALERFLDEHTADVATGFFFSLTDEGDMLIEWRDRTTFAKHRHTLVLPASDQRAG